MSPLWKLLVLYLSYLRYTLNVVLKFMRNLCRGSYAAFLLKTATPVFNLMECQPSGSWPTWGKALKKTTCRVFKSVSAKVTARSIERTIMFNVQANSSMIIACSNRFFGCCLWHYCRLQWAHAAWIQEIVAQSFNQIKSLAPAIQKHVSMWQHRLLDSYLFNVFLT